MYGKSWDVLTYDGPHSSRAECHCALRLSKVYSHIVNVHLTNNKYREHKSNASM